MKPTSLPGSFAPLTPIVGLLETLAHLATEQAKAAASQHREAARSKKGGTRRSGADTPLWLAVVESVRPHLGSRGAQANLARLLEVPRQRIHDYFGAKTQMPDAERLLHILLWLAARENDPAPSKSPKPLR